ncbi:hypothetical protein RyT2_12320 [Pseudolactococcus yaeyamensis]
MANKLTELSKDTIDEEVVDGIKSEREKILSKVESVSQSLANVLANKKNRKKDDYKALESELVQLKEQYVQSTDVFIENTDLLESMGLENTLLSDTNRALEEEIVTETQLFDKNQREISSNVQQLAEEKEKLAYSLKAIKAEIAVKQVENDRLDKEIAQLRQENMSMQPLSDVQGIESENQRKLTSLLREKAQIADLFINLKTERKESDEKL